MSKLFTVKSGCLNCPDNRYDLSKGESYCFGMDDKKIDDRTLFPAWCPLPDDEHLFPGKAMISISDDRVATIFNKRGNKVGIIDFSKDKVVFEGNMDTSAESLFSLLKFIIDPYFRK